MHTCIQNFNLRQPSTWNSTLAAALSEWQNLLTSWPAIPTWPGEPKTWKQAEFGTFDWHRTTRATADNFDEILKQSIEKFGGASTQRLQRWLGDLRITEKHGDWQALVICLLSKTIYLEDWNLPQITCTEAFCRFRCTHLWNLTVWSNPNWATAHPTVSQGVTSRRLLDTPPAISGAAACDKMQSRSPLWQHDKSVSKLDAFEAYYSPPQQYRNIQCFQSTLVQYSWRVREISKQFCWCWVSWSYDSWGQLTAFRCLPGNGRSIERDEWLHGGWVIMLWIRNA